MNFNIKTILIVLITFNSISIKAQLNYKDGFVITNENDTLHGKINDGGIIRNYNQCLFKSGKKEKAIRYLPGEIKSYQFINDKSYISMEVIYNEKSRIVFAEVLLEGKVKLYHDKNSKNASYYIQKDGEDRVVLEKVNFSVENDAPIDVGVEKYNKVDIEVYKDTLYSIFEDGPNVRNQIPNINYNQKSLINITKAFINETCKGDDCILYERNLELYRNRFGVFSGVNFSTISFSGYKEVLTESLYPTKAKSDIVTSIPVGVLYNIPLILLNERLSFQIELIAAKFNYSNVFTDEDEFVNFLEINSTSLDIPVLLKYEVAGKRISPSVSTGRIASFLLNSSVKYDNSDQLFLHPTQPKGWFFEFGFDYRLNPKTSVFSNFRVQSSKTLVVKENLQRQNYSNVLDDLNFDIKYNTSIISVFLGMKF